MKQRLTALDGIRGFAALSVMLSHAGLEIAKLTSVPFLIGAYKTFSVGPNSVQIFFVLCGFLMAYLYPAIHNNFSFLLKRYSRIFPIFGVVVVYLWLTVTEKLVLQWYFQVGLMIVGALVFAFFWKVTSKISRGILIGFLALQGLTIVLVNIVFPLLYDAHLPPEPFKGFFTMLSNVTMTTVFTKDINGLSGVFWSLTPEVLFYLIYPFFVIPLIQLGRKQGVWLSLLIILGMTKVLFDLDTALVNYQSFFSLNIARSAGFIAGVTVGTIYFYKGEMWKKIQPVVSHPAFSLIALAAFLFVQWGDTYIRDGHSRIYMNYYYILSSWVFACVILAAVSDNTILNKIFSWKVFRFLGTISYSLYLTHTICIDWARQAVPDMPLVSFALSVIFSITLAWLLFEIVESLYFKSKKLTTPHLAKESKGDVPEKHFVFSYVHLIGIGGVFCLLLIVYLGEYSPTILVQRHKISSNNLFNQDYSLLDNKLRIPFKATYQNLSIVSLFMRHEGNVDDIKKSGKPPANMTFRLYEKRGKSPIYESVRDNTTVASSPKFPFGLPPVQYSKDKEYIAEISLTGALQKDHIVAELFDESVVTAYTQSKRDILRAPHTLIINRAMYILQNFSAMFGLLFILVSGLGVFLQIKKRAAQQGLEPR